MLSCNISVLATTDVANLKLVTCWV